jgi:hypothetical protein
MADLEMRISTGDENDNGASDIVFRRDTENPGEIAHAGTLDENGAFWPFQSYRWDGARWAMRLQPQRVDAPFELTTNDGNGFVQIPPG